MNKDTGYSIRIQVQRRELGTEADRACDEIAAEVAELTEGITEDGCQMADPCIIYSANIHFVGTSSEVEQMRERSIEKGYKIIDIEPAT